MMVLIDSKIALPYLLTILVGGFFVLDRGIVQWAVLLCVTFALFIRVSGRMILLFVVQ